VIFVGSKWLEDGKPGEVTEGDLNESDMIKIGFIYGCVGLVECLSVLNKRIEEEYNNEY